MNSNLKNTFIITVLNVFSLILAFLSNVFIAAYFGVSKDMDAYLTAISVPFFIQSVFVGGLNVTFIPFISGLKLVGSKKWKIISSMLNLNVLLSVFMSLIIFVFARPMIIRLFPGFHQELNGLIVSLMRIQVSVIFLTCLNELIISLYFSQQRFLLSIASRLIIPSLTILFIIILSNKVNVYSLVYASISGSLVQLLILVAGIVFDKKHRIRYFFNFQIKKNHLIDFYKVMAPLAISMILTRSFPIIEKYFASELSQGTISSLGYAYKLFRIIPIIVASGISLAYFPVMSGLSSSKNFYELKIFNREEPKVYFVFYVSQ